MVDGSDDGRGQNGAMMEESNAVPKLGPLITKLKILYYSKIIIFNLDDGYVL